MAASVTSDIITICRSLHFSSFFRALKRAHTSSTDVFPRVNPWATIVAPASPTARFSICVNLHHLRMTGYSQMTRMYADELHRAAQLRDLRGSA